MTDTTTDLAPSSIPQAAERAIRAIPPLWPLGLSVAVNPYLGQAGLGLAEAAAQLARVGAGPLTMPRQWYAERIEAGQITAQDLHQAGTPSALALGPDPVAALKAAACQHLPTPTPLPTVADLAVKASGVDWSGLIAERIGAWAGGYFDEGQALWTAPRGRGAYAAWRAVATHDLTPEIAGLADFALFVSETPETAEAAIARAVSRLGLRPEALETYFHRLLTDLGGWAQFARYRLWRAELQGQTDETVRDFLAIRLVWEQALFERYRAALAPDWLAAAATYAEPSASDRETLIDVILQEAAERGAQRRLAATLAQPSPASAGGRPQLQAVFCIDVRSEVFRRALEGLDPAIQTLGFAGFFGLPVAYRGLASDVEELRLPVLLNPALHVRAAAPEPVDQAMRIAARAKRAWGRFKFAAVSAFAFVEGAGALYAGKLVRDALGLPATREKSDPPPRLDPALELAERITAARGVLRAMSLTGGFAPVVALVGHGAAVVNNPHASALQCGACGGYSGEVNARLLAALLNDADVRTGLSKTGIEIPPDTLFVGALHETTTDRVTLYDEDHPSRDHQGALDEARRWFAAAGAVARTERALRFGPGEEGESLIGRGRDWSQVRPEWGLAGCEAFIAAPRSRTAGKELLGRAFLHDYDWRTDEGFEVLELILTAPVVVASWISLQYYGSTVAPQAFGAGDKLLHNVVGGLGVIEGNGGRLRGGLPWQSVHDGRNPVHAPLRLSVCIEAPRTAIAAVLARHPEVKALFDNRWLHLFGLDEHGRMAWRYAGDLKWSLEEDEAATPAWSPSCSAERR